MKSRNNTKKKLTLIDKLEVDSDPLQKTDIEALRKYEAIGLKSYFSTDVQQNTLKKIMNPRVKSEEDIVEQITFYIDTEKKDEEQKEGIFSYNQTITALLTYNRKVLISPLYQIKHLHKILSKVPKNKILDTKKHADFFQQKTPRGQLDLKKTSQATFIHYLTKENLEEIKKYVK